MAPRLRWGVRSELRSCGTEVRRWKRGVRVRSEGQLRSQVAALSLCQEVSGFDGTRYRGTMCGVYAQFVPTRVLRERGPEVTPEEDAVNTR